MIFAAAGRQLNKEELPENPSVVRVVLPYGTGTGTSTGTDTRYL